MATATTKRAPTVAAVDESASEPAPGSLAEFIDVPSLQKEVDRAADRNRSLMRPYRQYQKRCLDAAGVKSTQLTRQLSSNICGIVARLPLVPDDEEKVEGDKTEFELQIERSARQAEEMLDSEAVMTTSARKIARAALSLRKADPDGSKGVAWVNDQREDDADVLDR